MMKIMNGLKNWLKAILSTFSELWMRLTKPSKSEITESLEPVTPTLKTVSTGEYQPATIDTFNIGVRQDIAQIQAYSTLPKSLYPSLFQFAVQYSKLGLAVLAEEKAEDSTSYAIYQEGERVDLAWVTQALNRLDPGWTQEGNLVFSPSASTIRSKAILDTLKAGMRDAVHLDTSEALQRVMVVPR